MAHLISCAVLAETALVMNCALANDEGQRSAGSFLPPPAIKLVFNEQGQAVLPKGFRSRVHSSTSWSRGRAS